MIILINKTDKIIGLRKQYTQLYMELSSDPSDPALTNLESALMSLSSWFLHNELVLNPEKSEVILLGTTKPHYIQF